MEGSFEEVSIQYNGRWNKNETKGKAKKLQDNLETKIHDVLDTLNIWEATEFLKDNREFLHQLYNCQLLKEDPAQWSELVKTWVRQFK